MDMLPRISPEWLDEPVIVAASGPSLTASCARECRLARWLHGWRVLAVNDACKALPWADAMYAADISWWRTHEGAKGFNGIKYTSHSDASSQFCDDKTELIREFKDLHLVNAHPGKDFSTNQQYINYGEQAHSGFQAVNLALLLGAKCVVLVGFDYRFIDGKSHFFGDHPYGLSQFEESKFRELACAFNTAPCSKIVNATPGSRITAYPQVSLDDALCIRDGMLHRHRPIADTSAD